MSERVAIHHGDSRDVLRSLPDCTFDSILTDPPYALVSIQTRFGKPGSASAQQGRDGLYRRASAGFMGQQWDTGETAFDPAFWVEVLRVAKPGAHVVAFGGTRSYHRLACAIEDAGWEVRDQLAWVYGTGFPKSLDVAKAIDKALGAEGGYGAPKSEAHRRYVETGALRGGAGHPGWQRPWMNDPEAVANAGRRYMPASAEGREWDGWGTALKPAWEPILLARKPLDGTVAQNVLRHGCGALNIDGCRIEAAEGDYDHPGNLAKRPMAVNAFAASQRGDLKVTQAPPNAIGRWPANLVHDGSDEVLAGFPSDAGGRDKRIGISPGQRPGGFGGVGKASGDSRPNGQLRDDAGSAARFFYSAKAGAEDRFGSRHPTVKPVDLMRWLVRLITPRGGLVLDPFAGSGTTGQAALAEGCRAVLIEREAAYVADIRARIAWATGAAPPRSQVVVRHTQTGETDLPLFGGAA